MWVKICANTSLEDTLLAIEAGADAVGFVFAPSKRQVTAHQVAVITAHLPATVETVGVYTTTDAHEIVAIHRQTNLRTIQLHGTPNSQLTDLLRTQLPSTDVIQTVAWNLETGSSAAIAVAQQLSQIAPGTRILLDSQRGTHSGGTGLTFDWQAAQPVLARYPELRFILAGGLSPANISKAIRTLHPWGVDVASGVESTPGRKDHQLTQDFIQNAKRASTVEREI